MTSTYASTFSSFLGSSSLLTALPDSPCSPVPEAEEQEEELPAADDPYWPRFRAVWGVVEEDGALAACSGRGSGVAAEAEALALKKWRAHQRWRSANQLDAVFERPHPLFHFLKREYGHCFHKRARDGTVVVLERCDQFASMVHACGAAGASLEDVAMHAAAINEFLGQRMDPRPFPHGRTIRILDASELSVWDLGATVVGFARQCTRLLGPNYPERVEKVFIVNSSSTFAAAYAIISSLFSRHLLDKLSVYSSSASGTAAAAAALLELIAAADLPVAYGGACACAGEGGCWRNSPEEAELWRVVEATTPPNLRRFV